MNREQIDTIIKQGLFAYATSLLTDIGREAINNSELWVDSKIRSRERALKLLNNDALRAQLVDVVVEIQRQDRYKP